GVVVFTCLGECIMWCDSSVFWLMFFFFFQAEDGIRDLTVTGVQTCALPISAPRPLQREAVVGLEHGAVDEVALVGAHHEERGVRSEERRVGKECRSRWAPEE